MERNQNHNKFVLPEGYTNLGWQRHSGNCIEIKDALEKGYSIKSFDNSIYKCRCTDVVYIIDEAKIAWHVDMSD